MLQNFSLSEFNALPEHNHFYLYAYD